jgi:hypothetical protein
MVRGLAGIARAGGDRESLRKAKVLLDWRRGFDFSWLYGASMRLALRAVEVAEKSLGS